jgi:O-antigen ligase
MYFILRFSTGQFNRGLGVVLGITCLIFWIFVLIYPHGGIMHNPPYTGSYRGFFWHRIYTASFAALAAGILIPVLASSRSWIGRITISLLTLSSIALCIGSKGAAGAILLVVLGGVDILYLVWLRLRPKLSRKMYWIAAGILLAGVVIAAANLDFIFGLLNRNTSLTGRIPMWQELFKDFWAGYEWLGYGFGTFWSYSGVGYYLKAILGWGYPILNGDNGLVDLLLNVGILGSALFVVLYGITLVRSVQKSLQEPIPLNIIPVIVLLFIFIANITHSWILELESLSWILLCVYSIRLKTSPG